MRPALPAALCCFLASTSVRADPPTKTLQLTYTTRGPGTSMCPDEAGLRKAVLEQLGRDPFRPDAPYRLTAAITASFNRHGREFRAALTIEDATGRVVWTENRLITMAPCTTLVLAIGGAVAGWLHDRPRAAPSSPPAPSPAPPPPPTPVPPPSPTAARPTIPAPPPNASTPSKLALGMGLIALVNIGIMPKPSFGATYFVELRPRPTFSIDLGVRVAAGASTERDLSVQSMYASATLAPCARSQYLFLCPLFEVGSLRFQGPPDAKVTTRYPFVAATGGRLGGEWPFFGRFSLHGSAEFKLVPTVTHLRIDEVEAWRTPLTFFSLGLGITLRMW